MQPHMIQAAARVPLTCGELAQGFLDGEHLIITAPIDWCSTAMARKRLGVASIGDTDSGPWQGPRRGYRKVCQVLRSATQAGWVSGSGHVCLRQSAPRGKGLGTSTADMAASVAAASHACGNEPDPWALGRLLATLEPTDGSMHEGVALFASRTGEVVELLPQLQVGVGIVDWGGTVDTTQFHRDNKPCQDAVLLREAFANIKEGLQKGDPHAVGWGAYQSALERQQVLHKPGLEQLHEWVVAAGGYGLCVAHTGTVAGLLFDPHIDWQWTKRQIAARFPQLSWLGNACLSSGGIHLFDVSYGRTCFGDLPRWQPIRSSS